MTRRHDLDQYVASYRDDPFERENVLTIHAHIDRCIAASSPHERYLELGIGHGITIQRLGEAMDDVLVLDASPAMVREYSGPVEHVVVREVWFEDFETDEQFHAIGMGFILEHVDDPGLILRKFGRYLAPDGKIFVAVPNAGSMHRRLGHLAGLLDDINAMSDVDLSYGHKRYWTHEQWCALFRDQGFAIARAEGLYLKPLSQGQMDRLQLADAVYAALVTLAAEHPAIANSTFYELRPAPEP